MTRYASSEDRAVGPTNQRTVSQMGTTFNGTGNRGVGGYAPPENFQF